MNSNGILEMVNFGWNWLGCYKTVVKNGCKKRLVSVTVHDPDKSVLRWKSGGYHCGLPKGLSEGGRGGEAGRQVDGILCQMTVVAILEHPLHVAHPAFCPHTREMSLQENIVTIIEMVLRDIHDRIACH